MKKKQFNAANQLCFRVTEAHGYNNGIEQNRIYFGAQAVDFVTAPSLKSISNVYVVSHNDISIINSLFLSVVLNPRYEGT